MKPMTAMTGIGLASPAARAPPGGSACLLQVLSEKRVVESVPVGCSQPRPGGTEDGRPTCGPFKCVGTLSLPYLIEKQASEQES